MTQQPTKTELLKKSALVLGIVAMVFVVFVVVLPAMLPIPRTFDSEIWKTCTDHSIRYAMHVDLMKHKQFVGMNQDELMDLLGKPDSRKADELSWDMGQAHGMDDNSIDFKTKDGKVISVNVWGR